MKKKAYQWLPLLIAIAAVWGALQPSVSLSDTLLLLAVAGACIGMLVYP